jgi:hypothetical protein
MADEGAVESDGIRFEGVAAALSGDTVLLVQGTRLTRGAQPLMAANRVITAACGDGRFALSCTDDTEVTLNLPNIRRVRDGRGRDLPGEMWSTTATGAVFHLEPGFHALQLHQ